MKSTKEKQADMLIVAARYWQIGHYSPISIETEYIWGGMESITSNVGSFVRLAVWASAALSEVGALGFDVEDVVP